MALGASRQNVFALVVAHGAQARGDRHRARHRRRRGGDARRRERCSTTSARPIRSASSATAAFLAIGRAPRQLHPRAPRHRRRSDDRVAGGVTSAIVVVQRFRAARAAVGGPERLRSQEAAVTSPRARGPFPEPLRDPCPEPPAGIIVRCRSSRPSCSTSTASSWTARRRSTNRTGASSNRYGASLTTSDWCDQIGIWNDAQDERWFRELCRRCSTAPDSRTFLAEKRRIFDEVAPREPMRGVRELVEALAAAGIPAAIASSSSAWWIRSAVERIGMGRQFARNRDRRRGRAPEAGAGRLPRGGAPGWRRSGAVGRDRRSAPGIAAARAAGMATVAIPHWLTERHDLSGADLRVANAGELTLPRLAALVSSRLRPQTSATRGNAKR